MKIDVTLTPDQLAEFILESVKARYPNDDIGNIQFTLGCISPPVLMIQGTQQKPGRSYSFYGAMSQNGNIVEKK